MSTHEVVCPNCKTAFTIDESAFADIVSQVRNAEFEAELHQRLEDAQRATQAEAQLAAQKAAEEGKLEIEKLKTQLEVAESAKKAAIDLAKAEADRTISELKSKIENAATSQELAVIQAVTKVERERDAVASELAQKEQKFTVEMAGAANTHKLERELLEGEIKELKERRMGLNTPGLGDDLEQFCMTEFNKIRAGAFPNSYFAKDTNVVDGTKGDFIFRENSSTGVEVISIMFEMKNQSESTQKGTTNNSHLAKLDKDRKKKGCEYAVLVSTLEPENPLYAQGVYDVSHEFPEYQKMYIVRPQFFIHLIIWLRSFAQASLADREALALMRQQNIDVTTFVDDVEEWKKGFAYNYTQAGKRNEDAIGAIKKAIKNLEDTLEALEKSQGQWEKASSKVEDLTIKRLTRGNPTMRHMFDELGSGDSPKAIGSPEPTEE